MRQLPGCVLLRRRSAKPRLLSLPLFSPRVYPHFFFVLSHERNISLDFSPLAPVCVFDRGNSRSAPREVLPPRAKSFNCRGESKEARHLIRGRTNLGISTCGMVFSIYSPSPFNKRHIPCQIRHGIIHICKTAGSNLIFHCVIRGNYGGKKKYKSSSNGRALVGRNYSLSLAKRARLFSIRM